MHERNHVEQWRNLKYLHTGRLAIVSVGIELAGVATSLITREPLYYQALAPLGIAANTANAAVDTAQNDISTYFGGYFRKAA